MKSWKRQNEEKLNREFADFEISQPLVRQNQTTLISEDEEGFDLKGFSKKLLSTLSIFAGVFLTYECSLVIFHAFIANIANISNPLPVFFVFIVGLIFTILGNGRLKTKNDYLVYLSVPFMSLIVGFLFTLAPANWHGRLFGGFSLFFFPLVLFVFCYLEEHFTAGENDLK